jgi:hypothetical protein
MIEIDDFAAYRGGSRSWPTKDQVSTQQEQMSYEEYMFKKFEAKQAHQ